MHNAREDHGEPTENSDAVWEDRLARAAQRGATEALHRLGLDDDAAVRDVTELRSLLDGWRALKTDVWRSVTRWVTMLILGGLTVLLGIKFGVPSWPK